MAQSQLGKPPLKGAIQRLMPGCMGQKQALWTEFLVEIVNRAVAISAKSTTGNKVSFTISSTKFDQDPALIAGEGQSQIQTPLPHKLTVLHFFAGVGVQARRRRHAAKHSIHKHKVHSSIGDDVKVKAKQMPDYKSEVFANLQDRNGKVLLNSPQSACSFSR